MLMESGVVEVGQTSLVFFVLTVCQCVLISSDTETKFAIMASNEAIPKTAPF